LRDEGPAADKQANQFAKFDPRALRIRAIAVDDLARWRFDICHGGARHHQDEYDASHIPMIARRADSAKARAIA